MNAKRNLYILCGGSSRRMGRDKAMLKIDGETFIQRIVSKSKSPFAETVLLSGSNTYHIDIRHLEDKQPDSGPLGGLLSGLQDVDNMDRWIAIVPIDLPLISQTSIHYLAETIPDRSSDAHIARSDDRIQPLCGLYHTSVQPKLEHYLTSGNRRVMGFLKELNYSYFNLTKEEIRNVNSRQDFEQLNDD